MQQKQRIRKIPDNPGGWVLTVAGDWRTVVILAVSIGLVSIAVRSGLTLDQVVALIVVIIKKVFNLP